MRLEGSFTRSRVKFCDSPTMRASSIAFCKLGLIAACNDGEGVNLLVLAVALVVVGIEVADEGAFDDRLDRVFGFQSGLGDDEGETAQSA